MSVHCPEPNTEWINDEGLTWYQGTPWVRAARASVAPAHGVVREDAGLALVVTSDLPERLRCRRWPRFVARSPALRQTDCNRP